MDQEDACEGFGVPADRLKWCDHYRCDEEDLNAKEAEEMMFDAFTDRLYEMDCILDQTVPKDVGTVEDRWVREHPGEDKWGLR